MAGPLGKEKKHFYLPFFIWKKIQTAIKLKGGGSGLKGLVIKNKYFFQRSSVPTAIKLEGGGLGLNGLAVKRRTFFFGFPTV